MHTCHRSFWKLQGARVKAFYFGEHIPPWLRWLQAGVLASHVFPTLLCRMTR